MEEVQNQSNKNLLTAVRTVGIIKPKFNPLIKGFETASLEVSGTGFWLASGIFITCAHVVGGILNQPVEIVGMLVVGGNEKPYRKATISFIDYVHDIAVLNVEPNNDQDFGLLNSEIKDGLEIWEHKLSVGDAIAYAGFPLGTQLLNEKHSPSYAEGVIGSEIIEDREGSKIIQISGPVIGGYSGAPIVLKNDYRKVVSMVSNSPSVEAGHASIFRGVHWKHIEAVNKLFKS